MINEKSFFCRLDGVFVLEVGKLDALLDGTVHALYQSITLRMVQCSSGVFDFHARRNNPSSRGR